LDSHARLLNFSVAIYREREGKKKGKGEKKKASSCASRRKGGGRRGQPRPLAYCVSHVQSTSPRQKKRAEKREKSTEITILEKKRGGGGERTKSGMGLPFRDGKAEGIGERGEGRPFAGGKGSNARRKTISGREGEKRGGKKAPTVCTYFYPPSQSYLRMNGKERGGGRKRNPSIFSVLSGREKGTRRKSYKTSALNDTSTFYSLLSSPALAGKERREEEKKSFRGHSLLFQNTMAKTKGEGRSGGGRRPLHSAVAPETAAFKKEEKRENKGKRASLLKELHTGRKRGGGTGRQRVRRFCFGNMGEEKKKRETARAGFISRSLSREKKTGVRGHSHAALHSLICAPRNGSERKEKKKEREDERKLHVLEKHTMQYKGEKRGRGEGKRVECFITPSASAPRKRRFVEGRKRGGGGKEIRLRSINWRIRQEGSKKKRRKEGTPVFLLLLCRRRRDRVRKKGKKRYGGADRYHLTFKEERKKGNYDKKRAASLTSHATPGGRARRGRKEKVKQEHRIAAPSSRSTSHHLCKGLSRG